MKQFLLAFIVFLIWSVVGTWYYSCKLKNLCIDQNQEVLVVESPSLTGFIAHIGLNDIEEIETDATKLDIYNRLKDNQDKVLHINAYFDKASENETFGESRAKKVIGILASYGINESRIKYDVIGKDQIFSNGSKSNQIIEFDFEEITEEDIEIIESSIKSKLLFSEFGSGEFIPDRTLIAYVEELKYYLSSHPEEAVEVIGHTDNVGSSEANYELGLRRAENVKDYMVQQGIEAAKIKASSNGQDNPIADNSTAEGRKQNRRIEIKVN
jgi:OOP family OmpA-OmpF porin